MSCTITLRWLTRDYVPDFYNAPIHKPPDDIFGDQVFGSRQIAQVEPVQQRDIGVLFCHFVYQDVRQGLRDNTMQALRSANAKLNHILALCPLIDDNSNNGIDFDQSI